MRTMLADLNTHINSLAPVNRIPAEFLSMVLKNVEEDEEATVVIPPPSGSYVDRGSLVRMTHVCRHWRQVALRTAILWTRFDMRRQDKSQAFFERSRGLPFSLHLSADRAVFHGPMPEGDHNMDRQSTKQHGDFPMHRKVIELNHLRSLVFSSWVFNDAMDVLKQLTSPSQSLLRLHDIEHCPADHDEAELLPCFPSFDHITHLDLRADECEMFLVADEEFSGFWLQARIDDRDGAT
ncbi:hypothetical protein C8Q74DRAFT_1440384 [Fomes fomentarius]|nr:hypothetical protein C8Q74DRAFT_1440384 [Fomes fomentarius]